MSQRSFENSLDGTVQTFGFQCDRCGKWINIEDEEKAVKEAKEAFDASMMYNSSPDLCAECRQEVWKKVWPNGRPC